MILTIFSQNSSFLKWYMNWLSQFERNFGQNSQCATSFLQGFLILLLALMFIRRTRYGQYGHCIPNKESLPPKRTWNQLYTYLEKLIGSWKTPYLVILSTLTALENTLLQINASVSVATFFAKLATWSFEAHLQPFP